jgi:hypothetical protein
LAQARQKGNVRAVRALVATILLGSCFLVGCDSCSRHKVKRKSVVETERTEQTSKKEECSVAADCAEDNEDPCTTFTCEDGICVTSAAPAGTKCDNGNVCDGIETCDRDGRCAAGVPTPTDDGNACTIDSCDPRQGVMHQPVPVDDNDACTLDSCDPRTGAVAHNPVTVDDGDDCTTDACDPRSGVTHQQPSPYYSCDASCREGFHSTSKAPSRECGVPNGLRNFCTPNCGGSFYTCDMGCPTGYQRRSEARGGQCGPEATTILFCVKG